MTDTSNVRNQLARRAAQTPAKTSGGGQPTISDLINRQRDEIARALPKHMDPDRLARIALTTMKQTPALLECSQNSLLGALMLCAQTGLEPGPLGHVYLIPRRIKGRMECQWMLGYKGIIELARRSGQLTSIEAREVCENDEFVYSYGLDEELVHRPYMGGDRGPVVAVWGLAKFTDGGHYFVVLSRADIDAAMARSDSAKKGFGPWITDYAAMARKTAIRRMTPYLPLSPEQANVMAYDETVNTRIAANLVEEPPAWIDTHVVPPAEDEPVALVEHVTEPAGEPAGEGIPVPADGTEAELVADEPAGEPDPFDDDPDLVGPPMMTGAQSKKLHALLRQKFDGASGPARFPVLSASLGREITSTKEITAEEASMLIGAYEAIEDGQ